MSNLNGAVTIAMGPTASHTSNDNEASARLAANMAMARNEGLIGGSAQIADVGLFRGTCTEYVSETAGKIKPVEN